MKRVCLSLLLLLVLTPVVLCGQSVLQFPRVIATGDIYTGIAVGNPTPAEASITFTAFEPAGTLLGGAARNPVTVTIPPAGQYARLFPEIFGVSSFNGWVQASSSTSGLTAFSVCGNGALTDLNGAGSTPPALDIVLPLAAEDSATRTEVTIVNVNSEGVSALLTLYAPDGRTLATRTVTLPARGLTRQTLATLMDLSDLSAASYLRVKADRPIVAHEVIADFQMPGTSLRRETAALTGHATTPATRYVIPQFATGADWLSLIGVVNAGSVAQEITLTAFQEDGAPWPVPSNPKRVTLPAGGALRTTVGDLFGFASNVLSTGWIQISAPQGFVAAYIGYGNSLTPSFALVEATRTEDASRYAVFSHVAEGAGFYTGITLVNPGTQAADIEFYTLRPDGSTIGRATLTLGPNQKTAELFRELLPASLNQVGGWGFLRSSTPIVGAVLFGSSNGFALANVPQQLPSGDFIPPAQTTGAITGTVRSSGSGVAGIQVALTGPVTTLTVTDGDGRYAFPQLPAGPYKVTATRTGAIVVPSERSVSVNRDNIADVDFSAGGITPAGVPVLTFLTPASSFAGGGSQTIRVLGSDFTPSSVVVLNNQVVPTAFVDSTVLTAAISGSVFAQTGIIQVAVETPPPGGGRSAALPFTINAAPSDPLIAGRAAVGSFPAGVAIDVARRRALVTNQSGDSVSVLDLETLQSVGEILVGRSPAEGIDVDARKDIALVANPGSNDVSVIDLNTRSVTRTIKVGRFPIGLAINSVTSRAYVVNGEDNTVSVINLDTFDVIGQIAVGSRPSNIAVNPRTNQALVTNRGANSVSLLDLTNGSTIATIPVREFPRGVAIHPTSNRAVVVNANGNSVSIIDLGTRSVEATVAVGAGPTSVALNLTTNSAVVTNSGVTRADPNVSNVSTVSVINLDQKAVIATISVGSAAFGVAVEEARQLAVVADFGSNDVTLVRIPNPVPRITSIDPKTFPVGGGSFTVTVRGTGFVPSSVMTLNKQPLPTDFVSTTELHGTITATLVDQLLHGKALTIDTGKGTVSSAVQQIEFSIGVENPAPGGGSSPPSDIPGGNSILPQNAVPVLLSLSPPEILINTTDLTLTLNGNNFNGTSIVNFGSLQFSASASSSTSMTVMIPRAQLSAGAVQVYVTNPSPGGGTSAVLSFRVNAETNPAPAVTSVNPSSILAGSGNTTVVVSGTGFITSSTGTLAGISGAVSSGTVSIDLPASQTENAGTLNGLITTPAPGGGTATFSVNIVNPAPTVGGFFPASAELGTTSVTLQVDGTNFRSNSQITFAGTAIPTTFVSSIQLSGTIASNLLSQVGQFPIGVTNPAPGGGSATGAAFRITEPIPVISSITPINPHPGDAIQISGINFRADSTVLLRGSSISSSFGSAAFMTATIPINAAFGNADIVVSNPPIPNGSGTAQASNPFGITVTNPAPTLSSLSPSSAPSGTAVTLLVYGTNFDSRAQIVFGGFAITTTFISTEVLSGIVTLGNMGFVSVVVQNPGGFNSNALTFLVEPPPTPAPIITGVSPDIAQYKSSNLAVSITGMNFGLGTNVTFAGNAVAITNLTSTSMTIAVSSDLFTPGNKLIAVTTPPPGGGTATALFLVNAFPVTPFPAQTEVGARQQFFTNVEAGLIWSVNGVDGGNSTYGTISTGGLYAAPATVPTPSTFRICARYTSDASVVACANMTVTPVAVQAPTISAISPADGIQGGAAVTVTLTGTNFIPGGTTINVSGDDVTAVPISVNPAGTSLTATFTISPTAAAGMRTVTVTTAGGTSTPFTGFFVTSATDIVTGFSKTSNPNGPWSYGFSTQNGAFNLYDQKITNPPELDAWRSAALGVDPNVTRNNSGAAFNFNGIVFPPDMLHLHPGPNGQYSVVQWTAPAAGVYSIAGAFKGLRPTSVTTTDVHVLLNTSSLFDGSINSYDVPLPFNIQQNLFAGDTIRFVVGPGSNGNANDSTGVSGTITRVTSTGLPIVNGIEPPSGLIGTTVGVTLTGANFVGGDTRVNLTGAGIVANTEAAGIAGWWAGENNASDKAGLANGTATGVTFAAGQVGQAFSFDGVASKIVYGSPFIFHSPGNATLEFWLNYPSQPHHPVFWTRVDDTDTNRFNISVNSDGTLQMDYRSPSGSPHILVNSDSAVSIPNNTWTHVAIVRSKDVYTVYKNGVVAATATDSGPDLPTSMGWQISGRTGFMFSGKLDEVSVYNRALSANDIQSIFNSGSFGKCANSCQVTVVNSTTATTTFTITPQALPGARNVSVTTSSGTSANAVTFTVNAVQPTLSSITPTNGTAGATVPVTLIGTDFIPGAQIDPIAGINISNVVITSSTSITATFTIQANAAAGTRDVRVTTSGGQSNSVQFVVNSSFNGATFVGTTSSNWSVASNWSTGTVPTATTNVLIPSTAANQPVLTANVSVNNLTVQNGATLNTAGLTITVGGNVSAGNTISGTGTVLMPGVGVVEGTLPNLTITGSTSNVEFVGPTTITGNLLTTNGGRLRIDNPISVTVNGTMTVNGTYTMSAGTLNVNGTIAVGNTATLTGGTLNARNNISISTGCAQFATTGTQVVLDGTTPQTVSMNCPGTTNQRFQNLDITNTAGAVLNQVQVNGNLNVLVGAPIAGSAFTVNGPITTAASSNVTATNVSLGGVMNIGGTFTPGTTTFFGAGQSIQAGLGYQNVVINGTASFAGATTIGGNLTISGGGTLDQNGQTVTVTGNMTVNAPYTMAAGTLNVNGDFAVGNTAALTGGTLNARKNISISTGCAQFPTTAQVMLDGTTPQTVSMNCPGTTNQRFQNLDITNTAGAVLNQVQVNGNLNVPVGAPISGSAFTVNGPITTAASSNVTATNVSLGGVMNIGGTFTPGTTTFFGAGQSIQAGLGYQNVVINGTASFAGATTISGNLTISGGGTLDQNGQTVTVAGNMTVNAPYTMAAGTLNVNGDFSVGNTATLTGGTLNARKNISISTGCAQFPTTAQVMLNGTTQQTVSMNCPGTTNQRFQNLDITNTAGAILNNVQVNGNLNVTAGAPIAGSAFTVNSQITTGASSSVTATSVTLSGVMTIGGTFTPGTTTFIGTGQSIQAGLGYQNVVINGTASFAGATTISGNLTISGGGTLDQNGQTVTVAGNMTVNAPYTMAAGTLNVNGDFSVGNTATLTGGTLNARKNISISTGCAQFPTTAQVMLNGTTQQTVSMNCPGTTNQRFQNLDITNTAGAILNNVQVNGNLNVTAGAPIAGSAFTVNSQITTGASSSVTATSVTLSGVMTIGGTFTPGTTTFIGTGQSIQAGLGYQNVVINGSASFAGATTISGNLTISGGGTLNQNGQTVTVAGNMTVNAPYTMAAGTLNVNGNFAVGNTATLTGGTLNAGRNISISTGCGQFPTTGTQVVLNGTTTQTVSMNCAGATNQRFQNLQINNPAGVVFSTAIHINGSVTMITGVATGPGPVTIAGNLTDASQLGPWQVAATTLSGSPTDLPPIMSTNLTLTGAAALPKDIRLIGNLAVSGAGAALDMNCHTFIVIGNFLTTAGGVLKMLLNNGCPFLFVNGDVTFDGGSEQDLLEDGGIAVNGNFKATTSDPKNFAPTNSFMVLFNASTPQTITMAIPGPTNQHFAVLQIVNPAGVSMGSDLVVTDLLTVLNPNARVPIIGNGKKLITFGVINVLGLDLDNVLLTLNLQDQSSRFDDVVFRNYPDTAANSTRITIASGTGQYRFNKMNFVQGVPTTAFLVDAKSADPFDGFQLQIYANVSPTLAAARTNSNGPNQVVWNADIMYSNNFENSPPQFNGLTPSGTLSGLSVVSLPTDSRGLASGNQSTWLGRVGLNVAKSTTTNEIVTLSLTGLAANTRYQVAFDLFIGGSWEGSSTSLGPDLWRLTATSGATTTTLVNATFELCGTQFCLLGLQSYSDATPTGGVSADFAPSTGADFFFQASTDFSLDYAIYYFSHGTGNPVLTFTSTGPTATLTFQRISGSSNSADEYWGLDNLTITPQ